MVKNNWNRLQDGQEAWLELRLHSQKEGKKDRLTQLRMPTPNLAVLRTMTPHSLLEKNLAELG